jgi:sigma-B regulation protein RsbU (phosphoserine phosphatase)
MKISSLLALDGGIEGRRFRLKPTLLLGRGAYNHIVLDDSRVSRQHSKICAEAGGYVIYDLNSANGTYVNGVRVQRKNLDLNDEVRIGPFAFRCVEASSQSRPGIPAERPEMVERRTMQSLEALLMAGDEVDPAAAGPQVVVGLTELEDAHWRFKTLHTFMQSISGSLEPNDAMEQVANSLLEGFPSATTVAIFMPQPPSEALRQRILRSRLSPPPAELALPQWVTSEVVEGGRSLVVAPPSSSNPASRRGIGLSMYAPLVYHNTVLGLLVVQGDDKSAPFTQSDLELLISMAAPAAMTLQNARLHRESLTQQRLQLDLQFAEQIQKSFLPREFPGVDGIEFATEYRPAFIVGGDFFDVFWADTTQIGIFIGDVSGKGVSAALLMARISSDLRIAASAANEPGRALASVNNSLLSRQQHDIFFTGVFLTLDIATGNVVLANAGHPPPFVRRKAANRIEEVSAAIGPAAGILENVVYETTRFSLAPGDSLALYTDGVIEATDTRQQQYGLHRLSRSIAAGTSKPSDIVGRVLADLRAHMRKAQPTDDVTIVVCGLDESTVTRKRRDAGAPVRGPVRGDVRLDVTELIPRTKPE